MEGNSTLVCSDKLRDDFRILRAASHDHPDMKKIEGMMDAGRGVMLASAMGSETGPILGIMDGRFFLHADYGNRNVAAQMQAMTEQILRLAPPGGLFDETVIGNLFPLASAGARALLVHRACQADEILRLKPGLFVLAPPYRKTEPHPFVLAASLHAPSHVSLESALAHHGLIPEAVYQVSSVTVARSREFRTPLGVFSFRRVPALAPRAGVEAVAVARNAWAFVATPLRAIADLVYLNKNLTWKREGLSYLTESLRMEEDDLRAMPFHSLDEIVESFRSRRVNAYLQGLKGAIGHAG